jgi:hypothetical protein
VVVNVNHGELGAGNLVDGGVQHGMRMVVPQKQSHAFGGIGILGVLDVLSRNRTRAPGTKPEREKKGKAKMIPERVPAGFPGNVHFFQSSMVVIGKSRCGQSCARNSGIATLAVYPQTKEKGIKSRKE